ncbi:unnamed protein product [Staurois parvus]|uniref:Uncharacterized protein n=1 Tax=Staurois parvus TaxID=386267 RepID=A0ABN9DNL2_9NEOB|nr:unnamed protein product [Staurois parvus]
MLKVYHCKVFMDKSWKYMDKDCCLVDQRPGTDNSWGPRAIGDHGAPVSLPTLKAHPKKHIKGTRGISWGPLLTPGPRAVPEFTKGQSAPAYIYQTMGVIYQRQIDCALCKGICCRA